MSLWSTANRVKHALGLGDYDDEVDTEGYDEASEILKNAGISANNTLKNVDTSRKTVSQLYNEGNEAAGQAAANKAGIAKREAKAAASMNGAGKLASAVQGAQAATDAVQNGYDSTVGQAASLSASQDNAQKSAAQQLATQQASNTLANANTQASVKTGKSDALNTARQSGYNRLAGTLSDARKSLLSLS